MDATVLLRTVFGAGVADFGGPPGLLSRWAGNVPPDNLGVIEEPEIRHSSGPSVLVRDRGRAVERLEPFLPFLCQEPLLVFGVLLSQDFPDD